MSAEMRIGAVLHHQNFEFDDGTKKNKYLIVLGAKSGCDYLCALVTSQQWRLKSQKGCHHTPHTHFFIAGDGKNFFRKDTWIVLHKPFMMSRAAATQDGMQGIIEIEANLGDNITITVTRAPHHIPH